ncbi:MAG: DUF1844 domain-containing protein [bacterium]|nr:MAG: DUF1844 domain-containing protein [bacterium]
MTEDQKKDKDFKVDDRRTSSGAEGKESKPPEPEGQSGADKGEPPEPPKTGDPGEAIKVDFSTFIFSLFSSALIQLGDMADPITGAMDPNLTSAKQTIDIIDILRLKTQGNLTEEEDNLLENASAELKWKYLDALKKKN